MYTKFYDNTIITKFIKELVAKTNVPFISTWKPGDFAIRGSFYLTRDTIWKCQHTGWPNNINDICPENHPSSLSNEDKRFFKRVSPYVFGEEYYGITGRYESKILGYDATTHFYLGQYLRMMRDIYDLDLMPFYNCFGDELVSDIDFDSKGNVFSSSSKDSAYKILSVPVKFGKTYMISIDSEIPVECICAIYGSKGLLKELTENLNSVNENNDGDNPKHNTYRKFQRTLFLNPVLYKTVSWHQLYSPSYDSNLDGNDETNYKDEDYQLINDKAYDQRLGLYEKYLRLLIKVPKTNKSSVVVIEGDYPVAEVPESNNTNNVTWSNQYLYGTTINSKTVEGDWIRPLVIKNINLIDIKYDIEYIIINDENKKQEIKIFINEEVLKSDIETFKNNLIIKYINQYYGPFVDEEIIGNIVINKIHGSIINKDTHVIEMKEPLFSPLSLLQISDGNIYAFSDRLIEYLTQHAINHLDTFTKDIERVQSYSKSDINQLKNNSRYNGDIVSGVWDKDFQEYLFKLTKDSKLLRRKIDLTGYVDKDTESVISRGQEV